MLVKGLKLQCLTSKKTDEDERVRKLKATGNGTPQQCAQNLLSIIRGENPMERVKGIDVRYIDKLQHEAEIDIKEDVKWVLQIYEPRIDIEDVKIKVAEQENGNHHIFTLISDT